MNANPNAEAFGPWHVRGAASTNRQDDERVCRDRRSEAAWFLSGGRAAGSARSWERNCRNLLQTAPTVVHSHPPSPSTHLPPLAASDLFYGHPAFGFTKELFRTPSSRRYVPRHSMRLDAAREAPWKPGGTSYSLAIHRLDTPWIRWVPRHFMSQLTIWTCPEFGFYDFCSSWQRNAAADTP